mmetsp:Transcript_29493/g.63895  ORF Transcript_29493/g.63895 Transcript_29493/m.63895 type:complete len:98 (+) Transcript_29493:607-900(+)
MKPIVATLVRSFPRLSLMKKPLLFAPEKTLMKNSATATAIAKKVISATAMKLRDVVVATKNKNIAPMLAESIRVDYAQYLGQREFFLNSNWLLEPWR